MFFVLETEVIVSTLAEINIQRKFTRNVRRKEEMSISVNIPFLIGLTTATNGY